MKKVIVICISLILSSFLAFSQAKKPLIMVVPSDSWCKQNGYMIEFDNQGQIELLPDYQTALQSDMELTLAISKLGEMMVERGFPLKDLASSLKSIRNESVERSLMTSSDGDNIAESPLDKLKRVANADIWMKLTYAVNTTGPKRSLTFIIQGIDAYTDKQIAAASGTGAPSFSVEVPVLIEEGVLSYIDGFNNQLQMFFDDLFENGREVALECIRTNGSEVDYETEFNGEELGFIIEDWIADNTVQGRFSTTAANENQLYFEQVRIPLEDENGRALDTRRWANGLRRHLRTAYNIDAKLGMKGLGKAIIILGPK